MKTRTESEIIDLILDIANKDAMIRVVVLEGSRANPGAVSDLFQDYDLIFGVASLKPFSNNLEWIKRFGDLMILQMPDAMGESQAPDHKFTYLMQFMDGSRIDLNLYLIDSLKSYPFNEPYKVLLDKDSLLAKDSSIDESHYFPKQPTKKEFDDCCNEFWWVAPYVAKGLWRGDLSYARHMQEHVLRDEVNKMITWYFGVKTNFKKNPGKFGKHFRRYIEPEICDRLDATYANATVEQVWSALDNLCALFSDVVARVALNFDYVHQIEDDKKVSAYLKHVQNLDKSAKSIY